MTRMSSFTTAMLNTGPEVLARGIKQDKEIKARKLKKKKIISVHRQHYVIGRKPEDSTKNW